MLKPRDQITAIAPYLGGKRSLAPRIADLLLARGPVKQYAEPFHGSCAVAMEVLERPGAKKAVALLNDLHGLVGNLAEVVADRGMCEALLSDIAVTPLHEDCFEASRNWLAEHTEEMRTPFTTDGMMIAAAFHYLIVSWMGRNGHSGSAHERNFSGNFGGFCARFTTSGGDPAKRWAQVKDSIPLWWRTFTGRTTFTRRDALGVIAKLPDTPDLALYCDPPYLRDTRTSLYAVDVDDDTGGLGEAGDFHATLAGAIAGKPKARICVSYYQHERLARLYPPAEGWTHETREVNRNAANAVAGSSGDKAVEVLIHRGCAPC